MRIPKPVRILLSAIIAGFVIGLTLSIGVRRLGWPAYGFLLFAIPPLSFLLTWPIDAVDLWMRRKSRDPLWLMGHEGKEWLKTPEGLEWLKTPQGKDWEKPSWRT
jgi:hypothetical protein